ncbi:MAG: hypothetical protein ABSD38_33830, partial [Syntrophorhabdales bacterium]
DPRAKSSACGGWRNILGRRGVVKISEAKKLVRAGARIEDVREILRLVEDIQGYCAVELSPQEAIDAWNEEQEYRLSLPDTTRAAVGYEIQ